MDVSVFLSIVEAVEKIFTILAILFGGVWVYYNFLRGRVYRPRFEPQITGELSKDDRCYHIQANSKLKNVGLSKININHDASGIRIYTYEVPTDVTDIETADWHHIGTFPVFEHHRWIESEETIEDKILLSVERRNYRAFCFILRIVGRKKSWETKYILYI